MIEILQSISQSTWQSLPNATKARLRGKFKMKQSSYVNPPFDGFTQGDISDTFTVENINAVMGWEETDLFNAFEKLLIEPGATINKITNENEPKPIIKEESSRPSEEVRVETKTTNRSNKKVIQNVQGEGLVNK